MNTNRSIFLMLSAFILLTSCGKQQQQTQSRPNIVFMMGDDHAAAAISSYGSFLDSVAYTPHIDKLREQGAMLTNMFCTNSICAPSRATIMTGQYSNLNGVYTLKDTLNPNHETVAKSLHRHGYQTAIIGKWHLKSKPQGFDYFNISNGQGNYHNPILRNARNWPKGKTYKGFSTYVFTDLALQWLKQRDKDKPFMLMLDFKATHEPFDYGQKFDTLYQNRKMPEPKSLYTFYPDNASRTFKGWPLEILGRRYVNHPKINRSQGFSLKGLNRHQRREKIYQKFIKDFLRSGATIDDNVGRVLSYLKKHHLTKNTIVIYTADQGYFLGQHGMFDKRFMYDPSLRMPFIIRYPKEIKPGSTIDDIILNIDFAPTFLDYAGVQAPKAIQGRSFRANLQGKTPDNWRTAMYYRYWMHGQRRPANFGIRTQRYALMFFYGQPLTPNGYKGKRAQPVKPSWDFYDLQKDPREMHNVYYESKYQSTIKRLKKQLLHLKDQAGDTVIDNEHPVMQKIIEHNF
jgi:arylsulfatase A-like enzyme